MTQGGSTFASPSHCKAEWTEANGTQEAGQSHRNPVLWESPSSLLRLESVSLEMLRERRLEEAENNLL